MKKYLLPLELIVLIGIIITLFAIDNSNLFPQNYSEIIKSKGISLMLNIIIVACGCYIFFKMKNLFTTKTLLIFALTIFANIWFGLYNQSYLYLNIILIAGVLELIRNNTIAKNV